MTDHQQWLWERALCRPLNDDERYELDALWELMIKRKALPSGRILWMGGTEQAKKTEIAMFNCAFATVRDVYSAVDAFYLLLNGCGVGFKPQAGLLNGFAKKCKIEVVRSERTDKGEATNFEFTHMDNGEKVWELIVGDSGKAWAKALGKLLTMKTPVDTVRLDFSQIRPGGQPLAGYGWLASGDAQIADAFCKVCKILNDRADQILTEIDIIDIINLAGTTLTSRRSAEIALLDYDNARSDEFITMKKDHYAEAPWRSQSNNSLVFHKKPSKMELRGIFSQMVASGGSEPGLINGAAALKRAPWFSGCNPCGEILLGDGGLCNLVDIDLGKFMGDHDELLRATRVIARANYRQTCVFLRDGVLSSKWHETQEFLRLCGVGITGVVKYLDRYHVETLAEVRSAARDGAQGMARELGLPCPKAVTTIKPSGTLGKIMDTTEGLHRPLGRYIFNWVKFDVNDPLVPRLVYANYRMLPDPYSKNNVIVCLPVDSGEGKWTDMGDGFLINNETAIAQLERYRMVMMFYVDHNASVTITYKPNEIEQIINWLDKNWDSYVGVSFIPATDPTKTAADLGYPYLPQEVVSKSTYDEYVALLKNVEVLGGDLLATDECAGGACPIR